MNIRALFLLFGLAATFSQAEPQLEGTYWNFYSEMNWDVMHFEREGNRVYSEYIYDKGVISATLSGDTLRGWWREYNNTMACGPGDAWSGAILFLFDSTGTKFTGDWDYCGDSADLYPYATNWIGTQRDSAYNAADCGKGGRYWCDGGCLLAPWIGVDRGGLRGGRTLLVRRCLLPDPMRHFGYSSRAPEARGRPFAYEPGNPGGRERAVPGCAREAGPGRVPGPVASALRP